MDDVEGQVSRRVSWEIPGSIDRVLRPRLYWRYAGMHAAALVACIALGAGLTWLATPSVQCSPPKDGVTWCGYQK